MHVVLLKPSCTTLTALLSLDIFCFSRTISVYSDVQMIHGDFLKLRTKDWRDADVVFMNSTCFDETLMGKVAHLAGM